MSSINVMNVIVNNPVESFLNPFKFEIIFECLSELKEGKFTYITFRYRLEAYIYRQCRG